jgi:phosphohistidine phosphatase SixA
MVFDIRGRRRHVVKVVYAILALLMVASLFLVTGALNLGSIFGSASSGESAAQVGEKQALAIEQRIKKEPAQEEVLLSNLTRARVTTANAMYSQLASESSPSESGIEEWQHQLSKMSEDWSRYLAAAKEPSPGTAALVAPALFQLAERSSTTNQQRENVKAASEAQTMVAESRPSLGTWSNAAIYTLFTLDFKTAEEQKEKAAKLANTKFERESFENKYEEVEKNAKEYAKKIKIEEATKKSQQSESAGKEQLSSPLNLGGTALGGASLGGE